MNLSFEVKHMSELVVALIREHGFSRTQAIDQVHRLKIQNKLSFLEHLIKSN